jgi:heme ABC exporter ATP-binding subunit CcmA
MLKISELTFGFRSRRLFEKISVELRPGELVHIAGPNGAGKSTFMSIIAGILAPQSGSIEFYPGVEASAPVDDRRKYLEYLPAEANGMYTKMSAVENLKFWSSLRGRDVLGQLVFEALDTWGLNHQVIRDQLAIDKFSTGMKRRLALARLQLSGTPCWLLDEPIYGLDTKGLEAFHNILKNHLSSKGMCLVVSHDMKPLEGLKVRTLDLATGEVSK